MTRGNEAKRAAAVAREAVRMTREGINGKKLEESGKNMGEGIQDLWKSIGHSGRYGKSWCGAFAARSMQIAGVGDSAFRSSVFSASRVVRYAKAHPNKIGMVSLGTPETEAARNQMLSKEGVIRPGDIVAWRGHVGVVVAYDHKTGKLETAEGNTWGGGSRVDRAMTRTYQLRTDAGSKKQQAKAKRYFTKAARGTSTTFLRYKGKSDAKGTKAETAHSANRDMEARVRATDIREGQLDAGARGPTDAGVCVPTDAGVPSRAGGMPATPEQMGAFRDATSATEVAKTMQQQIAGDALSARGTSADIKTEIGRLQEVQKQFTNWESTYPQHAQDAQAKNTAGSLESRINQLNTYQKEREPTLGLKGVAPFQVLFDGKQVVVPAGDGGGNNHTVQGVSGRKAWRSDRMTSVEAQRQRGQGPIPEGTYWIDLRQRAEVSNPFAQDAWGPERLTIHPYKTTHTFGRGGFFIHGGSTPGSAGCIDLPGKAVPFLNHLATRAGDKALQIQLVVDYSPGRSRWAQAKLTPEQRKKIGNRMAELQGRNEKKGLAAEQLVQMERSLGMKPSAEAQAGKVSKALVWNIAAWQKEQQARGADTGGVDGEMGKRTRDALRAAGNLERQKKKPETERGGAKETPQEKRGAGEAMARMTEATAEAEKAKTERTKAKSETDAASRSAKETEPKREPPTDAGDKKRRDGGGGDIPMDAGADRGASPEGKRQDAGAGDGQHEPTPDAGPPDAKAKDEAPDAGKQAEPDAEAKKLTADDLQELQSSMSAGGSDGEAVRQETEKQQKDETQDQKQNESEVQYAQATDHATGSDGSQTSSNEGGQQQSQDGGGGAGAG